MVYLRHAVEPIVHLSLNQGTTKVREEFGNRTCEILRDRADLMKKRVAEFGVDLPLTKSNWVRTLDCRGNWPTNWQKL